MEFYQNYIKCPINPPVLASCNQIQNYLYFMNTFCGGVWDEIVVIVGEIMDDVGGWFSFVGFYGISAIEGYLMPNLLYTYILNIYDLVWLGFMAYQPL